MYVEKFMNRLFHGVGISEIVVIEDNPLHRSPKSLNRIEFGGILRQPKDKHSLLIVSQKVKNHRGGVIPSVIQHQNQVLLRIDFVKQGEEKGFKLPLGVLMSHPIV